VRAVRFHHQGELDALQVEEVADPQPAAGEVVIRVRAAALNGFDPMMLMGSTGLRTPLPMIPCGDMAGEIEALGEGVDPARLPVGAAASVYPILPGKGMMGEVTPGGLCERVAVPAECVLRVPDGVSFAEAAALPVAYGTAWRMLHARGAIEAGERVLVLGATGGVGVACVQFAKLAGAEVVACGRGAERCAKLQGLGADFVIDTEQDDIRAAVYARYGKPAYDGSSGGVDVVVNYIGGDTLPLSMKLLARHGRILVCGATAGHDAPTDLRYLWSFEQTIVGCNGWTIDDQAELLAMVAAGRFRPVIHAVQPMTEAREAYAELIDRRVFGKSVLAP
jgi:alcohol dehydrogenase